MAIPCWHMQPIQQGMGLSSLQQAVPWSSRRSPQAVAFYGPPAAPRTGQLPAPSCNGRAGPALCAAVLALAWRSEARGHCTRVVLSAKKKVDYDREARRREAAKIREEAMKKAAETRAKLQAEEAAAARAAQQEEQKDVEEEAAPEPAPKPAPEPAKAQHSVAEATKTPAEQPATEVVAAGEVEALRQQIVELEQRVRAFEEAAKTAKTTPAKPAAKVAGKEAKAAAPAPTESGAVPTEAAVREWKVVQLQEFLKGAGLKVGGAKPELVTRVLAHLQLAFN